MSKVLVVREKYPCNIGSNSKNLTQANDYMAAWKLRGKHEEESKLEMREGCRKDVVICLGHNKKETGPCAPQVTEKTNTISIWPYDNENYSPCYYCDNYFFEKCSSLYVRLDFFQVSEVPNRRKGNKSDP